MERYGKGHTVVKIEDLFLDPNNPRIIPLTKGKAVKETDIKNKAVQLESERLMEEVASANVRRYFGLLRREGFNANFAVKVAKLPGGGYVLCDGNTRVLSAKKILADVGAKKLKLDKAIIKLIENVPVEFVGNYGGEEWVKTQAKIHLCGPRGWSAAKRAGFIKNIMRKGMSKAKAADTLGIKSDSLRYYMDAYYAFMDLQKRYGERVDESKHFMVLKEIVKNPAIRRYLRIDPKTGKFKSLARAEALVQLIAPKDGSRPILNSNTSKTLLRVMGDDPERWDMALQGKAKEIEMLRALGEKGRTPNDIAQKLLARLNRLSIREAKNLDVDVLKVLQKTIGTVVKESNVLVKNGSN